MTHKDDRKMPAGGMQDGMGMPSADGTVADPSMHRGRDNRLGTEPVGKLLREFSIPAIIMMLFNSLYNIIDAAFLGNAVGASGIAVTTLAMPIMALLMAFSGWAGQGGTALAAIQLGMGQRDTAERTLGNSTLLLMLMALVIGVLGNIFIDPLLRIVGTTDDLWDMTQIFVSIVLYGFIFQALGMGMNSFLRTAGQPNRALWTSIIATVACILFNFLFVMVLGWGVAGSALATIVGEACGMAPVLWYFIFNKTAVFNLKLSCMRPDFGLQGQILMIGLASFLMQVASTVVSVILNQLLVKYGAMTAIGADGALSSIGVAGKCGWFFMTPIVGITMGAQPLIGYNYGAQQWHRVLKGMGSAIKWSVIVGAIAWAIIQLFPSQIVSLFGITGDLHDYSITMLRLYCLLFPLIGFQICGSSYFQSSGQPIKAAVLELTRQVIFLIPLYYMMPEVLPQLIPALSGLDALVLCTPLSDCLACIVTAIFVANEVRKLRQLRSEQTDFSDRPLQEAN